MKNSVIQPKPVMAGLFGMCLLISLDKTTDLYVIKWSLSTVSKPWTVFSHLIIPLQKSQLTVGEAAVGQ